MRDRKKREEKKGEIGKEGRESKSDEVAKSQISFCP